VLLQEAVEALLVAPSGLYVDGTFGRGGHSREILRRLDSQGRLLACDKDEAAETAARELAAGDPRLQFHRGSFAELPRVFAQRQLPPAQGILLDLGVSSPQLDEAERGFSFQQDGPLDMRMDRRAGESAADWLSRASASDIAAVLRDYGEERFARRIAAAIVAEREQRPLLRTAQLAAVVSAAHPRWEKHRHPAARTFQALRILVNRELDDLRDLLDGVLDLLAIGGHLVVISFHSLEDRIVKRFLRDAARGQRLPRELPVQCAARGARARLLGRAQRPGEAEVAANPRARSAVMRCAERLA
jgi:16S rRNA (cytosine1402-N4)-methyltransferase